MSESTELTRMEAAKAKFIKPVMAVLPAPKTSDVKVFIDSYAKVLAEFSDDALERAASNFLRTMRAKSMPTPGECFDLCKDAAIQIETERLRRARVKPKIPDQAFWEPEDADAADRLFASAWGRKAVADGVEIALWDFLVRHQRWPNAPEYAAVKSTSLARQAETRDFLLKAKENGGIKQGARNWVSAIKHASGRLKALANGGANAV